MNDFETYKMSIIHEMEETIKKEFMDCSLSGIQDDIDVVDMVAYLNDDDEVSERYGEILREHIDEFITYHFMRYGEGFDMMMTACNNSDSCDSSFPEAIMDYMYDAIDVDGVRPSQIIPRWGYNILDDSVRIDDIFKECFERADKINAGIKAFQSLWRGYDCRWKNPFMLLKE